MDPEHFGVVIFIVYFDSDFPIITDFVDSGVIEMFVTIDPMSTKTLVHDRESMLKNDYNSRKARLRMPLSTWK